MTRSRRWAADTISRWFAINIVAAIVIVAGMNAAFVAVAGVWARPSIEDIGLVDQAVAIERILDGVPRAWRPTLAAAARNDVYEVSWFADDEALPIPIATSTFHAVIGKVRKLLKRPDVRVLAHEPGEVDRQGRPETRYGLAISLSDGSWVRFVAVERSWGLGTWARMFLTGGFVVACSLCIAALASRRLARPIERFARQAQRFGTDVNAPAMPSIGPVEFRLAGNAFNEMQSRVQRYVADRTNMLAAISHDLRAPLTRMRLRGEFIDDEEQQRKLFRDVDEMQAMVNASLNFFREGSEQESATRFNLSELVETILDDFRDAGSDVDLRCNESIAYVGRPLLLRRAIANIIDNAIKYGARATVRLSLHGNGIDMTIDDDGVGIPEDLREDVFRPFYRIESSRNRQTGGVGLGLASARSAVRGHGGDIFLSDCEQGGLRVRIVLPLERFRPS